MEWLEFNSGNKGRKSYLLCQKEIQIPENIKEQVIVELYSK